MPIIDKEWLSKLSPILIPSCLIGLKAVLMWHRDAAGEDVFFQLPGLIAFSGITFVTWGFTTKVSGGQISQVRPQNDQQARLFNINEGAILLILLILQVVAYVLSDKAAVDKGVVLTFISLVFAAFTTYLVPLGLIFGRI